MNRSHVTVVDDLTKTFMLPTVSVTVYLVHVGLQPSLVATPDLVKLELQLLKSIHKRYCFELMLI